MLETPLKCPWPYFGGKARIADLVWSRFGDTSNYIEPFCGSAAVLLRRPDPPRIETVNDPSMLLSNFTRAVHPDVGDPGAVADALMEVINDTDPYVANAWRSIKEAPGQVATWADFAVDEAYLHAGHRWLVLGDDAAEFRRRMKADPDYFDAKRAGRWIHGACCWIGSGWCQERELREDGLPREKAPGAAYGAISGVHQISAPTVKRPKLSGGSPDSGALGTGVRSNGGLSAKMPRLNGARKGDEYYGGLGFHLDKIAAPSDAHRPQLADAYARGRGVHGNDSAGTCADRRAWLTDWMARLADRLRTVRVCCGDWKRVCNSPSVTTRLGTTGLFLDAPYKHSLADGTANRAADLYGNDKSQDVNALVDDVIAYCAERGADPLMRIAACCYEGEGYEVLESLGWSCVAWKASGGYGNRSERGKANAGRERLWFSPQCINPRARDYPLFPEDDT
jgi:DNA adenine methylase